MSNVLTDITSAAKSLFQNNSDTSTGTIVGILGMGWVVMCMERWSNGQGSLGRRVRCGNMNINMLVAI